MEQNYTEVETEEGTLIIDTQTKESVLIEKFTPQLSSIDVSNGTLYVDHSTRESVLVKDSDLSDSSDTEPLGIQA